jgi:hypothetical protein
MAMGKHIRHVAVVPGSWTCKEVVTNLALFPAT